MMRKDKLTRNSLTKDSLRLIYYSLIFSNLIYRNIIWGKSNKTSLKCLEVSHKNIIRVIMFRSRFEHTNFDFYCLKILKLQDINYFCSCTFVFKSLNNILYPNYYFEYAGEHHNYILRNVTNLDLAIPFVRSSQSQTSPMFYSSHDWNNLPIEIRNRFSISSFKLNLKNI